MKDTGPTVAVEDTQGSRRNMAQARASFLPSALQYPSRLTEMGQTSLGLSPLGAAVAWTEHVFCGRTRSNSWPAVAVQLLVKRPRT